MENRRTGRALALDALRGLAIIGMVLSGTITLTLPGWMYHAQVGPRSAFRFAPEIYGITWVDLVFPYFLFAMGAAIPVALSRKLDRGMRKRDIILPAVKRSILLVIFAISIYYCSPYRLSGGNGKYLLAILAFLFWFISFARFDSLDTRKNLLLNYAGLVFLSALVFLNIRFHPDSFTNGFSLSNNDIIILILANMAFFGVVLWLLTSTNTILRLGILAVYFALRLTANSDGSWNQAVFNFNPVALLPESLAGLLYRPGEYFFRMDFLKYLFIVIPGTIVGDMLVKLLRCTDNEVDTKNCPAKGMYTFLALTVLLVVANLVILYSRYLNALPVVNILLTLSGWLILRKRSGPLFDFYRSAFNWGAFWLLLGSAFEAYEGGIRKDHATMSYFFISSSLAIFTLLFFSVLIEHFRREKAVRYIVECGQNPMVAYVAGTFVVVPLISLAGLMPFISNLDRVTPWFGLIKGVIVTSLMMLITIITVRKKWFWKT